MPRFDLLLACAIALRFHHSRVSQVRCAVKTLKESVRSNMYEVDKFRREASMLRSLRHPGVLRVIAVNDAKFSIAIEIMPGGSLHSLLHGTSQVSDNSP